MSYNGTVKEQATDMVRKELSDHQRSRPGAAADPFFPPVVTVFPTIRWPQTRGACGAGT